MTSHDMTDIEKHADTLGITLRDDTAWTTATATSREALTEFLQHSVITQQRGITHDRDGFHALFRTTPSWQRGNS